MDKNDVQEVATNAAAGLIAGEAHAQKVAALTGEIRSIENGRPYRIKENGDIEIVERLEDRPTFRRGDAFFYEALSFARFVKRFRNGTTVLFADALAQDSSSKPAPRFTALLDYHTGGDDQAGAQWDLFRAYLPLRHTPSWTTWASANAKQMEQAAFAQFIEDNIPDIADPPGGQLVEIARTLEANNNVSFQSHIRADNGSHRFGWVETITGSANVGKDGKVDIPAEITLALQPFEGSKQYAIKARLRYRLAGGKVTLGFELIRMQDVLKEAFDDELVKISAELNGGPKDGSERSAADAIVTPIYNGPAPAPQTLQS